MKFAVSKLQVKSMKFTSSKTSWNVSTTQKSPFITCISIARFPGSAWTREKTPRKSWGNSAKTCKKNTKKLRLPWRNTWKCETKLKPLSKTVHFGSQKILDFHPTQSRDLTCIFLDSSVKSSGNNTELIELLARFAFAGLQIKFHELRSFPNGSSIKSPKTFTKNNPPKTFRTSHPTPIPTPIRIYIYITCLPFLPCQPPAP